MPHPNVIFILCDQMRGDGFGADGHPVIRTPNLDRLATRGARFTHAYTAVPSCIPARATIWTGQDQWHTGVLGMGRGQGPIPDDFPCTLAGELTRAGYRTHMIGKGHFHPHQALMGFETRELEEAGRMLRDGFKDDYRTWFGKNATEGVTPDDHGVGWNSWHARPWHTEAHLHPTAWTVDRAIAFMEERDRSRPFLLNISFHRPHSPYVPPEPYFEQYARAETPSPYIGDWATVHDRPEDQANPNAWRGRMTPEQIHRARSGYYGEISFIDHQIGRFLDWMGTMEPETLADSWILFTSDHGDMQGDHHMWRKTYAYEGSARIPFLLVPPASGGPPGRPVTDEVVELRDVMPTLLQAAGLALPNTMDGRDLLPLLDAPSREWRKYIHGEHCTCYSPEQEMQYVTDGRRKYIWLPRTDTEQFFDLEQDPGECYNLIHTEDRQEEIAQWRGHLVEELAARECGWVRDGRPFCPDDSPLVSPYKDLQWSGESEA